jgi:hypothetical protein
MRTIDATLHLTGVPTDGPILVVCRATICQP